MYQDAFENPTPLANEYPSQAVHKFVVGLWEQIQAGAFGGGGGIAIPAGQTSGAIVYYGVTNNIHTVTYQPSGSTLTLTYVGSGVSDDDLISGWSVS